jgi:hypothetical protein
VQNQTTSTSKFLPIVCPIRLWAWDPAWHLVVDACCASKTPLRSTFETQRGTWQQMVAPAVTPQGKLTVGCGAPAVNLAAARSLACAPPGRR